MSHKILRKVKRIYRQVGRSLTRPAERTMVGIWGESQVRKIRSLGQEIVVMQMST